MAEILLLVLIFVLVAVTAAFIAVACAWKYVSSFYQEAWMRLVSEGVQVFTAIVAIGGSFAASADDKRQWFVPAITGAVALGISKLTQIIADFKAKQSVRSLHQEAAEWKVKAERAEAAGVNRTRLLTTLREPVKRKHRRVQKEVDDCLLRQKGASIREVRRALICKDHLEELLFNLAVFFRENLSDGEQAQYQFRVGLYLAQDGVMRPVYGVSSKDRDYNPFSSHKEHEQFFRLDSNSPVAQTVLCVRQKQVLIVPDCEEAKNNGKLVFFNDRQPSYLKSLAACYIGKVAGIDGQECEAALVFDTDILGFSKRKTHSISNSSPTNLRRGLC